MKIAAIIATYNRKEMLKECLRALLSQTRLPDEIIVVDGHSTDGTDLMIRSEFPQITYIRLNENMGSSGNFYQGMKLAYEKGYDWIWILDDDSEPKENTLEDLIKWSDLNNVVALVPTVRDEDMSIQNEHRGYLCFNTVFPLIQKPLRQEVYHSDTPVEITFTSFVGPLISRKAISKVGFPCKEFFIYHDDVEYSIRLVRVGKIYLIPKTYVIHKIKRRNKNLVEKRFLGKKVYIIPYYDLWRRYYAFRNIIYLGKLYSTNKLKFIIDALKLLSYLIIKIILIEDKKLRRLLFFTSAYIDGFRGVFDNTKPKRIL
ncbi:MAG: glycosyltransferase family 2 protein, partial [Candidatus Micrarchaeia archaeon]